MTIATPHLATNEHNPLGISAQGQLMRGTGREGRCWFGPGGHGDLLRERQRHRGDRGTGRTERQRGAHTARDRQREHGA